MAQNNQIVERFQTIGGMHKGIVLESYFPKKGSGTCSKSMNKLLNVSCLSGENYNNQLLGNK